MASEDDRLREQADQLIAALDQVLYTGRASDALPDHLRQDPRFQNLVARMVDLSQFTLALANGNLNVDLRVKGQAAGGLKSLQANLRHLTWQAKQIASGDLTQRVAFMGDFATAFNQMVERLQESRALLENRAEELARQQQIAVSLMQQAQAARAEAEKANLKLQDQIAEITQLQIQLREQAIRDPLTGCFNRRYLIDSLEREFSRAAQDQTVISIIMLDIDHFKQINDTYGHLAGDEVLRLLGKHLQRHSRPAHLAARYGGEEFVLVLPGIKPLSAVRRANKIRLDLPTACSFLTQPAMKLSLSAGVAAFPDHGQTYEEVLERADQALYAAKTFGRNRVICYR